MARRLNRQAGRLTITFDVRDENSTVQKAEYSLDGDRWQMIYPKDGIPDSRRPLPRDLHGVERSDAESVRLSPV